MDDGQSWKLYKERQSKNAGMIYENLLRVVKYKRYSVKDRETCILPALAVKFIFIWNYR